MTGIAEATRRNITRHDVMELCDAARSLRAGTGPPESKGVVERRNGWFETSFMPGLSFPCPADF